MRENEKLQKVLGKRIEEVCYAQGLSFYEVSQLVGVPMTTLMNSVNGKVKSTRMITIFKLCEGLGITLVDFFDTEEFKELIWGK